MSYLEDSYYGVNPLKRLYRGLLRYFQPRTPPVEIPWDTPLPVFPPRWVGTKATSTPIRRRKIRARPIPRIVLKEPSHRIPARNAFTPRWTGTKATSTPDRERPRLRAHSPIRLTTPRRIIEMPVVYRRPRIANDTYVYYGKPLAVSTPTRKSRYLPDEQVFIDDAETYFNYTFDDPLNQTLYSIDYTTSATSSDYSTSTEY